MKEIIICVAPYASEKQDEKFPGPMNLAHLHVRDKDGLQTTNTGVFQEDIEKIHSACLIIIAGSTGGMPEHTLDERCVSFMVPGIEMGSMNMGSINLWDGVYQNKIADILFYAEELKRRKLVPFINYFDLSCFSTLRTLEAKQLSSPPLTIGLVFGVPNSLPYKDRYLEFFLEEILEESNWFMVCHHAKGAEGFRRALELGGNLRVGYEDGPFLSDGSRARSNAELVEDVVKAAERLGRNVLGPERAREILGLT